MAIWVNADEMRERLKWDFDDEYAESIVDDCTSFSADMVEVVRCKDCKHQNEDGDCDIHDEWFTRKPDSFCCYGERKDND